MYFECIVGATSGTAIPLIVTCSSTFAGSTITASKTGATTQTQTCPSSSPYEVTFILPEDGTWTISGVVSGQTFSESVTILPYEASLNCIPDGSTVTPTDDIQTWLHCANIWDKSYTTIAQVLNDTATVTALIASNNAADYMARSTTWESAVTANSSAMTKIGSNDYCADKLLANSTWRTAICNSTYFESVLNVKVPTMTSNTEPSGIASSSSNNTNPQTYAYKAFNGTGNWTGNSSDSSPWVQYEFENAVDIGKIVTKILYPFYPNGQTITYTVKGSNDGNTFTDLASKTVTGTGADKSQETYSFIKNNNTKYKYIRTVFNKKMYQSGSHQVQYGAQFYGRA